MGGGNPDYVRRCHVIELLGGLRHEGTRWERSHASTRHMTVYHVTPTPVTEKDDFYLGAELCSAIYLCELVTCNPT